MYQKKYVSIEVLICPVCGRKFVPACEHSYKALFGRDLKMVCRYTCMVKAQKAHEAELKQRRIEH